MNTINPVVTARAAYSINDVIAATGFCRQSIYDAINSNKLIARKHGRRTVILAADLQAFLESLPRYGEGREAAPP